MLNPYRLLVPDILLFLSTFSQSFNVTHSLFLFRIWLARLNDSHLWLVSPSYFYFRLDSLSKFRFLLARLSHSQFWLIHLTRSCFWLARYSLRFWLVKIFLFYLTLFERKLVNGRRQEATRLEWNKRNISNREGVKAYHISFRWIYLFLRFLLLHISFCSFKNSM